MNYRQRMKIVLDFLFGPNDPVVSQIEIVEWLRNNGEKITASALSTFKNNFRASDETLTIRTIQKYYSLFDKFIVEGLGYTFDEERGRYYHSEGGRERARPGKSTSNNSDFLDSFSQLHYHPGRLLLLRKAQLIQSAQEEIVELGVRLHGFASYFTSQSDAAFQKYFEEALSKGVNIRCLLLNPDSEVAENYFEHRADFDSSELNSSESTRNVIRELKSLQFKLNENSAAGKLYLFSYNHLPYNHFFAIDRKTPQGVIVISSYLYGIKRAKSPVLIVTKRRDQELYDIYNKSLEMILSQAEELK